MYYWNFPLLILICILHPIKSNGNLVDGREYSCERSLRLFLPESRYNVRRDTRLNKFSPDNHAIREQNRDLSALHRSTEQRNSRITKRSFESTRQVRIDEDKIKSFRILNRDLGQERATFLHVRSENRHSSQLIQMHNTHTSTEWNINVARRQSRKIELENSGNTRKLSSDRDQVREALHSLDRRERTYYQKTRRVIGKRNIISENIISTRITDQSRKELRDEIRGRLSRTKEMRIQHNPEKKSLTRVDILRDNDKREIRFIRASMKRMNEVNIRNLNGLETRLDLTIRKRKQSQRYIANRDRSIDLRKETRSNSIEARHFHVSRDIRNSDSLNRRERYLNIRQRLGSKIREDTSQIGFGNKEESMKRFNFNMERNTLQNCDIQSRCDLHLKQRSLNGKRKDSVVRSSGGNSFREFNLERDVAVRNGDFRSNRHNIDSSQRVRINIDNNAVINQNKRNGNTQSIRRDNRLNVRVHLTNEDIERSLPGSSDGTSFRESTKMTRYNYMERDAANGNSGIRNAEVRTRLTTKVRDGSRNDFINDRQPSKMVRVNVEGDIAARGVFKKDRLRRDAQSSRRLENQIREYSISTFGRNFVRDNRLSASRINNNLERSYSEKTFLRNSFIQSSGNGASLNVKRCQFIEMRNIPNLISGTGTVHNNRLSTDRNRRNKERVFNERRDIRNIESIDLSNFNVKQRGSRGELNFSLGTRNSRNVEREYSNSVRNARNMTHKNEIEYDSFNWQALFYTLQAIYIFSIVFKALHRKEFTKNKSWSCAWLFIPDTKIN